MTATIATALVLYTGLAIVALISMHGMESDKDTPMPPHMRRALGRQEDDPYNTRVFLLSIFWPVWLTILIIDIISMNRRKRR